MPRTGLIGSYGNSVFDFLWSFRTVFWSTCTIFHSHQQWVESSNFSTSSLYLLSFWLQLSLVGVKWYLIVVWVCISFMANDVEHAWSVYFLANIDTKLSNFSHCFLKKQTFIQLLNKQKEWFTHFFHPHYLPLATTNFFFCICKLF